MEINWKTWAIDSSPTITDSGTTMETRLETPEYFKRAMLYREGEEVFGYRLMQTTVCPWQRRRRHFLRLPPHPAPTLRLLASTCFSFPLAQVTGWSLLRTLGPFVPRGFSHFPQLGGLSVSDLSCEVLERGFEEARESLGFPFFLLLILLPRAFAFSADCRFFECLCSLVAQEQG
jgi:hypothetical protein